MNGAVRVSVITNFLDAELFIEQAIESVFAQTYQHWELLLVDDGSSDCSKEIAQLYAELHPHRVRYLRHERNENRGASASRNLGVTKSRGEYIAFLDADDVWLPEKLEQQVAILDSKPQAAMVTGITQYWHSWTGRSEDATRDLLIRHGIEANSLIAPPLFVSKFLLGETPVPCPSDILVRRDAFERVGGFEESFRRLFTDQVFYAKLCLTAPIFLSNQCWSRYRKHPNSSISWAKRTGELRSAHRHCLKWLKRYFSEQKVVDPIVWRALRKAEFECRYPMISQLAQHARYRLLILKEHARRLARSALPKPVHRWVRVQLLHRIKQ